MKILRRTVSLALALAPFAGAWSLHGQTPAPAPATSLAAPAAPRAKLGSTVFKWEDFKFATKASGAQAPVVNQPTATLKTFEFHITTLIPGALSHQPHHHAQEELILLKEGTLDVNINGKTQRVGAGTMFLFASNDVHNVKNVGDGPATYFVFNFTTAATAGRQNQPPAAELAVPGKLPSSIFDWNKLVVEPKPNGARREVVNSPTLTLGSLEVHVTTLNPGEIPHAAHRHPDEEWVIVKEGLMEVTINGVSQRAGPGAVFFYGSNDLHGMKNVGTTPATYHVMRIVTEATPPAPPAAPAGV